MAAVFRVVEIVGAILAVVYLFVTVWTLLRGRRRYLPLVTLLLLPSLAEATTLNVAACNGTNDHLKVQTQVDAAINGDVVQIPAGTCTFAGTVAWTDKDITIQGAGVTTTTLTGTNLQFFVPTVTSAARGAIRIADMRFTGTLSSDVSGLIELFSLGVFGEVTGRFRLHHLKFDFPTSETSSVQIMFSGIWYGVADHIEYICNSCLNTLARSLTNEEYDHIDGGDPIAGWYYGNTAAVIAAGFGTDKFVFLEDSIFTQNTNSAAGSRAINDLTQGARMVFRHNTASGNMHWQTHATRYDQRGGLLWEVYNNKFTGTGAVSTASAFRSGTGVVYNNTIVGTYGDNMWFDNTRCPTGDGCQAINQAGTRLDTCNGARAWDGNLEANGWPCLDQIGRDPRTTIGSQSTLPTYFWNNGPQDKCYDTTAAGAACDGSHTPVVNCSGSAAAWIKTTPHVNGDKDYCVGTTSMPGSCGNHTNTYTAYTYPHPLQGAAPTTYAVFLQSWPLVAESLSLLGALVHFRRALLAGCLACATLGAASVGHAKQLTQTTGTVLHTIATKAAVVYLVWSNRRDR